MYVLDSAQLVPVGVCSVHLITGTEYVLNPFLSPSTFIRNLATHYRLQRKGAYTDCSCVIGIGCCVTVLIRCRSQHDLLIDGFVLL